MPHPNTFRSGAVLLCFIVCSGSFLWRVSRDQGQRLSGRVCVSKDYGVCVFMIYTSYRIGILLLDCYHVYHVCCVAKVTVFYGLCAVPLSAESNHGLSQPHKYSHTHILCVIHPVNLTAVYRCVVCVCCRTSSLTHACAFMYVYLVKCSSVYSAPVAVL